MDPMPSRDEILKALEAVIDPELRRSIVELEMVRSIDAADGLVRVTVSLTTPGCPIRSHFETAVRTAVGALPGVERVEVAFDVLSDQEKAGLQKKLGRPGDLSMTLAQLLPQAKFLIVTTPQPVAQRVARRSAEMAHKVDLEIGGVIENMAAFVTPGGDRFALFGEGGGQALADDLDVPLLGSVPLTMPLREQADAG